MSVTVGACEHNGSVGAPPQARRCKHKPLVSRGAYCVPPLTVAERRINGRRTIDRRRGRRCAYLAWGFGSPREYTALVSAPVWVK